VLKEYFAIQLLLLHHFYESLHIQHSAVWHFFLLLR